METSPKTPDRNPRQKPKTSHALAALPRCDRWTHTAVESEPASRTDSPHFRNGWPKGNQTKSDQVEQSGTLAPCRWSSTHTTCCTSPASCRPTSRESTSMGWPTSSKPPDLPGRKLGSFATGCATEKVLTAGPGGVNGSGSRGLALAIRPTISSLGSSDDRVRRGE